MTRRPKKRKRRKKEKKGVEVAVVEKRSEEESSPNWAPPSGSYSYGSSSSSSSDNDAGPSTLKLKPNQESRDLDKRTQQEQSRDLDKRTQEEQSREGPKVILKPRTKQVAVDWHNTIEVGNHVPTANLNALMKLDKGYEVILRRAPKQEPCGVSGRI